MKRLLLGCLCLLLVACAGGPRKPPPDWLQGQPEAWPASRYLVARGQGPSLLLAQERARAELAKAFQVRIRAASNDLTRYIHRTGGTATERRLEQSVTRQIQSDTQQLLEGVEIADVWQDPRRGTYYALAVLDRQRAAARLRQRLAALDDGSEAAYAQARRADPLGRVQGLYGVYRAQLARAALARAYTVVSPKAPPPAPLGLGRLQGELGAALAALRIAPRGEPQALTAALGEALQRVGVTVAMDEAPYRFRARLEVTPVGRQADWYWLRATLQLVLEEAAGPPRGERRLPLKAAALDEAQARARLLTEATRRLRTVVPALILGDGRLPGENGDGTAGE